MRGAECCSVDPSSDECADYDCSESMSGRCVPKADCTFGNETDKYFFNEFMGRCELKEYCPPMFEWSERSKRCETWNHCDQATDVNKQQYNVCVTECSDGMEFDEAMMRCMCPGTHYYYIDTEQYAATGHPDQTGTVSNEWLLGDSDSDTYDDYTDLMGYCREVPPCGEGREYKLIDWKPRCITPIYEENCEKGMIVEHETNTCVYRGDQCAKGEFNLDGECHDVSSCADISQDLVQIDALMLCKCMPGTHFAEMNATDPGMTDVVYGCIENDTCDDMEYYNNRTDECVLKPDCPHGYYLNGQT